MNGSCFSLEHHSPHTQEELRDDVFQFVANLSAETGVDLDPQGVWDELRMTIK